MFLDRSRRVGSSFLLVAWTLLALAACSSSEKGTTSPPPPPATGGLAISVSGVPNGSTPSIAISGPNSYSNTVNGSTTLTGLTPGPYVLTPASFLEGELEYSPSTPTSQVVVAAGTPLPVTVVYSGALTRGKLLVELSGLPNGVTGDVLVTGPNAYSHAMSASDTLESLLPGTYSVVAATVEHQGVTYAPNPGREDANVVAGGLAAVYMTYAEQGAGTADFRVQGLEIIQVTQRAAGDVALVRDRDALLRVYGTMTGVGTAKPTVRAELYVADQLQQTLVASFGGVTVPSSTDRSQLSSSWNFDLPASLVQPQLSVRVVIDPDNAVVETNETNNRFPVDGSRRSFTVRSIADLPLRLVPVLQSVNSLQGRVDTGNASAFVSDAAAIFPFPDVATEVRAPYTTNAAALQSNDGNGAWGTVLQEMLLLRNAEAPDRYYYGVVRVSYTSGVAGYGYISSSRSLGPNAAVGWDYTNSRAGVLAHELGHNLGRRHSPCGGPADADPNYPYAGAVIGQWGYDQRSAKLVDPNSYLDIMSYCNPQWISDYVYEDVMDFVVSTGKIPGHSTVPCLVVWGRVDRGELVLDPAFVIDARPHVPERRGEYTFTARDADGRARVRLSFDAPEIGCAEEPSVFAWLVPIDAATRDAIATLELEGAGRSARQVLAEVPAGARPFSVAREGRLARLLWDADAHPLVLVRDRASGEILTVARGGDARFLPGSGDFELTVSGGANSRRYLATVD